MRKVFHVKLSLIVGLASVVVGCTSQIESQFDDSINRLTIESESVASRSLSDSAFHYALTPDDPEWVNLTSHAEKIKICSIPEEQLKSLSTADLVEA